MSEAQPGGAPRPSGALGRLARQSGLYALGNVAVKALGLVLAPLYLDPALLSQAQFGGLVTLEATAGLLIPLLGLSLAGGLLKFTVDPALGERRDAVPFTTLALAVAAALVGGGAVWVGAPGLAAAVLDDAGAARLVRLLAVYVAAKAVGAVPVAFIRSRERAGLYVAAVACEGALFVGGVVYFLRVERLGLEGVLWAYAISAVASAALLAGGMLAWAPRRWSAALAGPLLRFSVPLALGGVVLPLLHAGDRYLLQWLAGAEEVAVYGWAAKLAGVLNMLAVQSFQLAFGVVGLRALAEGPEGAALHRRAFRHYCVVAGWMALGLALVAYDLTAWLSKDPDYVRAAPQVLPLALGFFAYGFFSIGLNVIYASGRSHLATVSVLVATALNVALNLVLIPPLGAMGAALATLASYAALSGFVLVVAEREIALGFPVRTLVVVVVAVVALWGLGEVAHGWPLALRLAWLAALVAAYPGLILAARVYAWADVAAGWRQVVGAVAAFRP